MSRWFASTRARRPGRSTGMPTAASATSAYTQDINFNGRTTASPTGTAAEILRGFDDWSNMRLNQVGARRNVGGPFFDRAGRQVLGPLSISMGRWDFGRWDFASSDLGRWDFGVGDASRGDLAQGDYGRWDFGRWDFGRWDFGRWDFGQPDVGPRRRGPGLPRRRRHVRERPEQPRRRTGLRDGGGFGEDAAERVRGLRDRRGLRRRSSRRTTRVRVSWTATNVGGVGQYAVYRVQGDSLLPGQPWTLVATVTAVPGQTVYAISRHHAARERGAVHVLRRRALRRRHSERSRPTS